MTIPIGTITNTAAVVAGSLVGLALGRRFPENMRAIVFQGLGLAVILIGLQMALTVQKPLFMIFSLIIGGIIGELIHLEDFLNNLGDRLKKRLNSKNEAFTEGFVSTTLLYCVGSMAIVGAFNEGLRNDPSVLYTKAMLDGFSSIALAGVYGIGVMFSAIPLFLYQTGLTLFAAQFKDILSPALINELTAVGGLLIVGIGINLLEIKKIKIGNLLPALVVIAPMVYFFA